MEETKKQKPYTAVRPPLMDPDEIHGLIRIRQIINAPGGYTLFIEGSCPPIRVDQMALVRYSQRGYGSIDAVLPLILNEKTGRVEPVFNAKLYRAPAKD